MEKQYKLPNYVVSFLNNKITELTVTDYNFKKKLDRRIDLLVTALLMQFYYCRSNSWVLNLSSYRYKLPLTIGCQEKIGIDLINGILYIFS